MTRYMIGSIDRRPGRYKAVRSLLLLALFALSFNLTAQEAPAPSGDGAAEAEPAAGAGEEEAVYEISEITFEVIGWTDERNILAFLRLEEGDRFSSLEELNEAVERFERDLYNQRVFNEVEVTYEILPVEGEAREVALHFYVDDGWTVLPVVFYRYNSNTGHNPFVVLYWDNFLGTLTDFGFSAGFYSREWPDAFGWDVRLDLGGVRMLDRRWNFGFDQEFKTLEKASSEGDLLLRYSFYTTDFGVSTSFRLDEDWSYRVSPGIGAAYGYETDRNLEGEAIPEDAVSLTFSHGVGTGRQDWRQNFREGWSFSVNNGFSYAIDEGQLDSNVSLSSAYFEIFGIFNPSVRGRVQYFFDGDQLSQGGDIRGVANSRVFGRTFFKANTNLAIRVLDIPRFSEFNLIPFLDAAVAVPEGETPSEDGLFLGAGVDLVFFPYFLRGFQGRISVGFDVRDPPESIADFGSYELAITESLAF
ncbi:MAG: POTRA domain-containing protein [Alkalispirochaetaceae bacterium]